MVGGGYGHAAQFVVEPETVSQSSGPGLVAARLA